MVVRKKNVKIKNFNNSRFNYKNRKKYSSAPTERYIINLYVPEIWIRVVKFSTSMSTGIHDELFG